MGIWVQEVEGKWVCACVGWAFLSRGDAHSNWLCNLLELINIVVGSCLAMLHWKRGQQMSCNVALEEGSANATECLKWQSSTAVDLGRCLGQGARTTQMTGQQQKNKNKKGRGGGGGGGEEVAKNIHLNFEPLSWPWPQQSNLSGKPFWLIVMHHSSKFGCKRISYSERRKPYFDDVSPYLEVEESKLMFLHDTLVHINIPLFQVWLWKV